MTATKAKLAKQPTLVVGEPLKIGYAISLSGALGANGKSARVAHQIWEDDVNRNGGLLGRRVQMIAYDDQTNAALVPGIYTRLLDVDKVDVIIGGYGTNTLLPAMPLVMERKRFFVGLMGLGVNSKLNYPSYFVMIPNDGQDRSWPAAQWVRQLWRPWLTRRCRSTFKTVVGDVKFGQYGEWAQSRVLQVQFQNVKGHGVEQFKDTQAQVVVSPSDWASGKLIYPYAPPER